jgi:hypothetical protein
MLKLSLIADNGFRKIKFTTAVDQPVTIWDSVIFRVPGTILHHPQPGSSFVTYKKGSAAKLVDSSWIIGRLAKDSAKPEAEYKFEKPAIALQNILAIVASLPRVEGEVVLSPLVILHHEPDDEVIEQYCKELAGAHEIVGNGKPLTVQINESDIHVEPESDGANLWALNHKQVTPEDWVFGYDLGGKTAAIGVYRNGLLVPGSRFVLRRGGTRDLAASIARDPGFKALCRETAKIDLIMEGLHDSSYLYGSKFSFAGMVENNQKLWVQGIIQEAVDQLEPWLDVVTKNLFYGGSAERADICKEYLDGVTICKDFATANVQGIALKYSNAKEARKAA